MIVCEIMQPKPKFLYSMGGWGETFAVVWNKLISIKVGAKSILTHDGKKYWCYFADDKIVSGVRAKVQVGINIGALSRMTNRARSAIMIGISRKTSHEQ